MKASERSELLERLEIRFKQNSHRHPNVDWKDVVSRLKGKSKAFRALQQMEATGGEPDVVQILGDSEEFVFCDCSTQSPTGRRSLCYDGPARAARKEHKPNSSALELAAEMGIELLTEEAYRQLQTIEDFDTKTSSWIMTPAEVRELGGALFCDRRYGKVFVYHNGAESYYAARGFRGLLHL